MDRDSLVIFSTFVLPLLIAITLHEAGHAFAANALGDPTAKSRGRLSINPLRHIDPFGTVILPGILLLANSPIRFGYAKPVPINYANLKHQRRDIILVTLAGPLVNVVLAFLSALMLHLDAFITPERAPWAFANLYNSVTVNLLLAVFNMLPIIPLDGGRIVNALLPRRIAKWHAQTEKLGIFFILLIFMLPTLMQSMHMTDISVSYYLIGMPMEWLRDVIFHAAGIGNG